MAGAIPAMDDGSSRASNGLQRSGQSPRLRHQLRALRPVAPSVSSSISRNTSTAGLASASPSGSSRPVSAGTSGNNGVGGVWTSLVSLSSALPSSIISFPRGGRFTASERRISTVSLPVGSLRPAPSSPAPMNEHRQAARNDELASRGVPAEASGERAAVATVMRAVRDDPIPVNSQKEKKRVYLQRGGAIYTCSFCRAHLAARDHVVSECFHGRGGRAFLFERCVNVAVGKSERRRLMTGMHVVADISCAVCGSEVGWTYKEAMKPSEKYKEGKFILERCSILLEGCDGDGSRENFADASTAQDLSFSLCDSDRWEANNERFGVEVCNSDDVHEIELPPPNVIGWGSDSTSIYAPQW